MALTKIKTDGVTDDAITSGKIPANAVGTSEIANNAVTSTQIADNTIVAGDIADATITLAKLEHGTGSNDGKFLRANNGADPTFESVSTTPEGTTVLSTGESGGTKFLREDGDGTCSWQALPASGVTVSNNADNRVVTGDGTNLVGEPDLIFGADGDANVLRIAGGSNNINSADHVSTKLEFKAKDASTNSSNNIGASMDMIDESGNGSYQALRFRTFRQGQSPSLRETVRFTSDGNIKLGLSGGGIDFSATSDTSGMSSELLDDYEEGTFTPTARGNNNNSSPVISGSGTYIKVGRAVHINLSFSNENGSYLPSGEYFQIHGLPFTASGTHFMGFGMNYKVVYDGSKQYYFYLPSGGTIMWGYINNSDQPYQPWGTDQWDNTQWYHNNTFTYRTT